MSQIHYKELLIKLSDPGTDEEELQQYFTAEYDPEFGLSPKLAINSEKVDVTGLDGDPNLTQGNLGLGFLNKVYQNRRRHQFEKQLKDSPEKPVILAEGDSWFEYPLWLEDTVDYLNRDYNVFCISAAGDELRGIVADAEYKDYLELLTSEKNLKVQAILLSGGGNDIVGEYLLEYLKPYDANLSAEEHITSAFDDKLQKIGQYYRQAITQINQEYSELPILIHGYDHTNPLPPDHDKRTLKVPPILGWLDKWMRKKGIVEQQIQRDIVRVMIDRFYQQLINLISDDNVRNVHLVDNRGAVQNAWFDELHPNDAGFAQVGKRFKEQLVQLSIK